MKNQPGTMKNHEKRHGTMKNQPGTIKNHENPPRTMKNHAVSQLSFMTQQEKVLIFRYSRGVTTDLHYKE